MTRPRLRGTLVGAPAPDAASPADRPLLVLLPSLGTTTELWDGVVARLAGRGDAPRILLVDLPGHGVSPATDEPFTVDDLAAGVLDVVDEAGGGPFHVAGDSLGGGVALELAATVPERVLSLAMFCSAAKFGTSEAWEERAAQVRASGTASLVAGSAQRWFAPGYLAANPDGPGGRALKLLIDVDDASYIGCCGALAAFDRRPTLGSVRVPALVASGEHDPVTTSSAMRELAEALPDARFIEVPGAGHLVPLEDPDTAAALLAEFIAEVGDASAGATTGEAERDDAAGTPAATARGAAERGMRVRRAVLGDAHVDRANAAITPETADFQDFITRYAWGEIWARPQLTRAERSIATLASLVTGCHEGEIRMHVRAALRNGLSRERIAEVILHTALYAGLPAANRGLAIMRDVFAELDLDGPGPTEPGPTEPHQQEPHQHEPEPARRENEEHHG
ncbi:alpha/beta fold hydrolase [Agromyces sp. MMS24-JH15]|uniref:bifunctional 3-oxoadipate enol-lactonase/4-carboxymuconolactone decarboxylase PcaDC n=1 Tax=Agromyces sp. MMS24-JH15 TaxID=3243765 RepID=UPI003749DACD